MMTLTLQTLLAMVGRSITNPREGAEQVLALGVPQAALWSALVLVAVLSTIVGQITTFLMVGLNGNEPAGLLGVPLITGLIQLVVLAGSVFAIYYIGRAFGGTGSLSETILLVTWLQFIMVCIQVVQSIFVIVAPPFAGMIGLLAIGVFLWLLTHFVAVIHGFRSLGQVL